MLSWPNTSTNVNITNYFRVYDVKIALYVPRTHLILSENSIKYSSNINIMMTMVMMMLVIWQWLSGLTRSLLYTQGGGQRGLTWAKIPIFLTNMGEQRYGQVQLKEELKQEEEGSGKPHIYYSNIYFSLSVWQKIKINCQSGWEIRYWHNTHVCLVARLDHHI